MNLLSVQSSGLMNIGMRSCSVKLEKKMPNASEYLWPNVSRKEQISLRSPEGRRLKLWIDSVEPLKLSGFTLQLGKRILTPIPKLSGVYFASFQNQVVYIGQSCCLHRRIHDHHSTLSNLKRCGLPVYISWELLPRTHRLKAEALLVRRFQPIFNMHSLNDSEEAKSMLMSIGVKNQNEK